MLDFVKPNVMKSSPSEDIIVLVESQIIDLAKKYTYHELSRIV